MKNAQINVPRLVRIKPGALQRPGLVSGALLPGAGRSVSRRGPVATNP